MDYSKPLYITSKEEFDLMVIAFKAGQQGYTRMQLRVAGDNGLAVEFEKAGDEV